MEEEFEDEQYDETLEEQPINSKQIMFFQPQDEIPKVEQKYFRDISKVMNLLQACVVTPDGEGKASVTYLIQDESNRTELENYVMNLTRKNLNGVITVNPIGFNIKKKNGRSKTRKSK